MTSLTLSFDGGCSPNPGNKYGSYELTDGIARIIFNNRFPLGFGTNNEAEFEALIEGLSASLAWIDLVGKSPKDYSLVVNTDSRIVLHRLVHKNHIHKKAKWKEASTRMFNLAERCLYSLKCFSEFKVNWNPREINVERFGH